ncbi:acetate/propionate family kinase [Halomonas sp. JS92-SW72]|uniref:acetate/propionate family kinase n=1 Tax=Halomonas sp. JS92-SW72 TaxID=2306583 RepID=UPI000E5B8550|nr:acetate/propionate family kinase [Halomonas sp. JS92-SW72]AXY41796.1 acetate/propionate family kinase [Halomonas sp. JS92-SW72]
MRHILTLNSGSSSLKFALYPLAGAASLDALTPRYRGKFTGLNGGAPGFTLADGEGRPVAAEMGELPPRLDLPGATARLLSWLEAHPDLALAAVGHRVVHGGRAYHRPVRLTPEITDALKAFESLAPLHQPFCLAPVAALAERYPELPQVACFDTAFHADQPEVARWFALPREMTERGLIRYGFHGLSYDYINQVLPACLGDAPRERVIVAHLGNGASLCAIRNGQSVASTMGFTAIEGMPMGTRSGSLDPGLVLHLIQQEGMSADEVTELLYKRSGLLGVSGISSDMRELLASPAAEAREAVALYAYRAVREIGSLAAALGGLDQLVFTAGIGERAAPVREAICRGCEWLGLALDPDANRRDASRISRAESRVGAWVIPTDEERMIAWYSARLLGQA